MGMGPDADELFCTNRCIVGGTGIPGEVEKVLGAMDHDGRGRKRSGACGLPCRKCRGKKPDMQLKYGLFR